MFLNEKEIKELVDEAIVKMTRLKFAPFFCCLQEAIYRVTEPFTQNVVSDVTKQAKLRISEFEKAWEVNHYQIKEKKEKCQTQKAV